MTSDHTAASAAPWRPAGLTERQHAVLVFIIDWYTHRHRAPTVQQISDHLHLGGPAAATRLVHVLQRKGWIRRIPGHRHAVTVLPPPPGNPLRIADRS